MNEDSRVPGNVPNGYTCVRTYATEAEAYEARKILAGGSGKRAIGSSVHWSALVDRYCVSVLTENARAAYVRLTYERETAQ